MDPLFPELPENFDALSDEDLTTWLSDAKKVASRINDKDPELLGDLSRPEVI